MVGTPADEFCRGSEPTMPGPRGGEAHTQHTQHTQRTWERQAQCSVGGAKAPGRIAQMIQQLTRDVKTAAATRPRSVGLGVRVRGPPKSRQTNSKAISLLKGTRTIERLVMMVGRRPVRRVCVCNTYFVVWAENIYSVIRQKSSCRFCPLRGHVASW